MPDEYDDIIAAASSRRRGNRPASPGYDEDSALDLIAHHESGNRNIKQQVVPSGGGYNPSVGRVTGPSTASGPWQITNSTWRKRAPRDIADKYPSAISAPVEVQRAVAGKIYRETGFQDWAPYNASLRKAIARGEQPQQPQDPYDKIVQAASPDSPQADPYDPIVEAATPQAPLIRSARTSFADVKAGKLPRKSYDTRLSPQEESQFQAWKQQYAPRDSGADYDLRGAFKAGLKPDPATGHWPDTFKKPNHPTFSNQSQYAVGADAAKAGTWKGDKFVPPQKPVQPVGAQARTFFDRPVQATQARTLFDRTPEQKLQDTSSLISRQEQAQRRGQMTHPLTGPETGSELAAQMQAEANDPIRQKANRMMAEQGLTPEKLRAERERLIRENSPFLSSPIRTVKESGALGTAGILDLAAGVGEVAARGGSPGAQQGVDWLRKQSANMRTGVEQAGEVEPLSTPKKLARDVGAGVIEFAPLMAAPELGVEGVFARIGVEAAKGGAYTALQSLGRGEHGKDIAKSAGTGAAMFGLFGVALPGKNVLTKAMSNLVIMGGGTTLINKATGQPWGEAATQGLVMAAMRSPELLHGIKVKTAEGERPATIEDLKPLAAKETVDAKVETQPNVTSQPESAKSTRTGDGIERAPQASAMDQQGSVAGSVEGAGQPAAREEGVRHVDLQPRRAKNVESGTKGQFKKETKAQAEARRTQVQGVTPEASQAGVIAPPEAATLPAENIPLAAAQPAPAETTAPPSTPTLAEVLAPQDWSGKRDIPITVNGTPMRPTVTVERAEGGRWRIKRAKLHDDATGRYQIIDATPEGTKTFPTEDEARIYGVDQMRKVMSDKLPEAKPIAQIASPTPTLSQPAKFETLHFDEAKSVEYPATAASPPEQPVRSEPEQGLKPRESTVVPESKVASARPAQAKPRNVGTEESPRPLNDLPETVTQRLREGRQRSATLGNVVDTESGDVLRLTLRPDTSESGTYSVVMTNTEGRSQSVRMKYKGGDRIGEVLGHFEHYLNTDNPGRFRVDLESAKAETRAETVKPTASADVSDKAELKRLNSLRFKTRGNEIQIERLKARIAADPSKWSVGNGVGWKVAGQTNRGFRIIEVRPETKQVVIRSVADTGLTTSGGNYDKISDQLVHISDLVRDNKYNAAPRVTQEAQTVPEAAPLIRKPRRETVKVAPKAETRGAKAEKVNRAGFTETQAASLAGDLKDYVRQQLEDTHGAERTRELLSSGDLSTTILKGGESEVIKVPGDGEFKVSSIAAANRLHQKVTGKPIEGLEKAKNASVYTGQRQGGAASERPVSQQADRAMEFYGEPAIAAAEIRRQIKVEEAGQEEGAKPVDSRYALLNELDNRARGYHTKYTPSHMYGGGRTTRESYSTEAELKRIGGPRTERGRALATPETKAATAEYRAAVDASDSLYERQSDLRQEITALRKRKTKKGALEADGLQKELDTLETKREVASARVKKATSRIDEIVSAAPTKTETPLITKARGEAKPLISKSRGEAGAIDVDLLTLGVRPFAKDVASKGREVAAGTREISDGIKSLLAPPSRGTQALQTSRIVRANASEMARAHDIAERSLDAARKFFGKQKPESNYDFIDKMERGQSQADPKTQKFADTFRQMLDERRDQIRALGTGKLESFIEDYFPHIWKDPKKAKDAFAQAGSKRPFEGSKAFLKQRTLPLTSDGLALGLEPVSNNPVDLATLKLREMDKYLMAHKVLNEMKDQGSLKFFKVSERIPDGWKQIDDRVATVFSRGEKGELILRGRYAAPEPAAKIINNYLSPGLNATMFRVPFKAWRATSNLLNQFQLGFSAFHAGFTTVDAMVSRTAVGFEDIARGKFIRGVSTVASTPVSPITNLIKGSKMLKEWYQPGTQGAEIGRLVQAMQEGGGRARMDQFYTNNAAQKFVDTLRQGNILGATIRAPGAMIETLAKPTMEWLVPRQKMGVFADMAKRELERLGPNATEAQRRHAMAKAWDSVDNRMGQMVYDNLFWNKTLKDLSMASVRSVGWNLGTLREIGGGLYDTANLLNKGMAKARGKKTDPLFTHRMAYTAALPLVVGTMGAVTQYLLTGKGPDELKDYFFPKTGAKDENGNPERIAFPSYMKDVFHAKEEPGKVVTNKLHPLIGLISEMLRNEDYYGTKIRNEDDPLVQQLKDTALHVGQSALPFSVRGYQKETERGTSPARRALPFVGVTPAPSYINKSPAEKLIGEKTEATLPRGARTREQADMSQLRSQLRAKARNGQDITDEVAANIKQGKLRPDDAHDILRDAKQSPLQLRYKHLTLKDALDVWDVMTPAERTDVKDILAGKAESVDDLPETEQAEVKKKMESIGLKPGITPRKPREQRQPRKPRKPLGAGYVFQ